MSAKEFLLIDAGNQRLKWRRAGVDYCADWLQDSQGGLLPDWEISPSQNQALVASVSLSGLPFRRCFRFDAATRPNVIDGVSKLSTR